MSLDRSLDAWRQRYDNADACIDTTIEDAHLAEAVNEAVNDMMATMTDHGFRLPGDDRIENILTQVFKLACEYHEERFNED